MLNSLALLGSAGDTGAQCGLRSAIAMMVHFDNQPWQPATGQDMLSLFQSYGGKTTEKCGTFVSPAVHWESHCIWGQNDLPDAEARSKKQQNTDPCWTELVVYSHSRLVVSALLLRSAVHKYDTDNTLKLRETSALTLASVGLRFGDCKGHSIWKHLHLLCLYSLQLLVISLQL